MDYRRPEYVTDNTRESCPLPFVGRTQERPHLCFCRRQSVQSYRQKWGNILVSVGLLWLRVTAVCHWTVVTGGLQSVIGPL
jgi:hypothetical protein